MNRLFRYSVTLSSFQRSYGFMLLLALSILASCTDEISSELTLGNDTPCLVGPDEDCEDILNPGDGGNNGGNTGGGGVVISGGLPARFQFINRGNGTKNIWSSWSTNGTGVWTSSKKIKSSPESDRGPTATVFNDRIYAFYKGKDTDDIFYTSTGNGSSWGIEQRLSASTNLAPVAVTFGNSIFVYTVAKSAGIIQVTELNNGQWGTTRNINGHSSDSNIRTLRKGPNDALGAGVYNGELILVFRSVSTNDDQNNQIRIMRSSDGINFSDEIGISNTKSRSGISTAVFDDYFYMAYGGVTSNKLYVTRTNDFNWFETYVVTVNGTAAKTDRTPGIATDGDRLVIVYEEDNGNRIYYAHSTNGTNSWSGNIPATGETRNGGPALVYTGLTLAGSN